MDILLHIILVLVCYLVGSFPTAYLVVKKWAHKDVRRLGSGNIGTMNVHRATESKLLTVLVLVADMAKGAVAIILAKILPAASPVAPIAAGAAAVVGHNYSLYMRFKGGRGLATAAGALIIYSPPLLLMWVAIWIIPYMVSKILLVGTLAATILTPVGAFLLSSADTNIVAKEAVIFAAVVAVIVLVRHISKIRKLLEGTEPKKYWKIRNDVEMR